MSEDAGSISAEIRLKLDEMERDALQAQKRMEHYAREFAKQGEHGGKLYVKGFGKGQADLNKRLNEMVSTMRGISPKMGELGERMASAFQLPVIRSIPAIAAAFQTMLPVIGTVVAAVAGIMAVVRKVTAAQKEHREAVSAVSRAHRVLAGDMDAASESAERQITAGDLVKSAFAKLVLVFGQVNQEQREYWEGWPEAERARTDALAAEAAAANELIKITQAAAREAEAVTLAREAGRLTAAEASEAELAASERYIDSLIRVRTELASTGKASEAELARYDLGIRIQLENRERIIGLIEEQRRAEEEAAEGPARQKEITEARQAAIERYEQSVRRANDAHRDGLIDETELRKQLEAALAQEYADLESIVAQYGLAEGVTADMTREIARQVKLNQDNAAALENQRAITGIQTQQQETLRRQEAERLRAAAASAHTEDEKNGLLREAVEIENELIGLSRGRERQALAESAAFLAATEAERERILADFDAITRGMRKTHEAAEELREAGVLAAALGMTDEELGRMMTVGDAAVSAFDGISGMALEISRKHAEEQIAIIDAALQKARERIEEAREAQLEAEGFLEAKSEEAIQRQIDAAREAGDEVLQYQLERRKREKEINDRYDAEAKAAEEKAAKEKADLQFKVAKEEYALQMIQAVNNGVMAVLAAAQNAWPVPAVPLMALAGATTAAQIGMLAANPPKYPRFEDGGIVPGNSWAGDRVAALVNSGELILNRAQQDRVAGQLSGGETVIHFSAYFDGSVTEAMAEGIFRFANDSGAMLEKRAVRGLE